MCAIAGPIRPRSRRCRAREFRLGILGRNAQSNGKASLHTTRAQQGIGASGAWLGLRGFVRRRAHDHWGYLSRIPRCLLNRLRAQCGGTLLIWNNDQISSSLTASAPIAISAASKNVAENVPRLIL